MKLHSKNVSTVLSEEDRLNVRIPKESVKSLFSKQTCLLFKCCQSWLIMFLTKTRLLLKSRKGKTGGKRNSKAIFRPGITADQGSFPAP